MAVTRKDKLLKAASEGNLTEVINIIREEKELVDCRDYDRRTPLSKAAWNGHLNVVKYLVEEGKADVNSLDSNLRSPLFYAASRSRPNLREEERSALKVKAAFKVQADIVRYLIEKGARFDEALNHDQITPLMKAASYGNPAAVECLLEFKADPNKTSWTGQTPLIYAVSDCYTEPDMVERHDDCAMQLIRARANVDSQDQDKLTAMMHVKQNSRVFDALVEAKANLELVDEGGRTVFLREMHEGSLGKLIKLRGLEVDINHIDNKGLSVVDLAFASKEFVAEKIDILLSPQPPRLAPHLKASILSKVTESKSSNLIKTLFKHGLLSETPGKLLAHAYYANRFDEVFASRAEWKREDGLDYDEQPLIVQAIEDEKYDIVKKLISSCDINAKTGEKLLLERALDKKNRELAELLIKSGADINAIGSLGECLLEKIIGSPARRDIIGSFLIEKGANVDITFTDGSTPLIEAVEAREEKLVQLILEKYPTNINAKNSEDRTALFIAVEKGNNDLRYLNIFAALLKANANPFIKCDGMRNRTVFDIARHLYRDMVEEYRKHFCLEASAAALTARSSSAFYTPGGAAAGATATAITATAAATTTTAATPART